MKIRGNTVGTTTPRSDWNQSNPRKADFILNKPDVVLCVEQNLSEPQKEQARNNINAVSVSRLNNELDSISTDIENINADMGNIDSALDAIIAMQESIIGGESV